MVRVLVSYKNCLDSFNRNTVQLQSRRQPFAADSAVNKDSAFLVADKGRVALAGAEKGVNTCHLILQSELKCKTGLLYFVYLRALSCFLDLISKSRNFISQLVGEGEILFLAGSLSLLCKLKDLGRDLRLI